MVRRWIVSLVLLGLSTAFLSCHQKKTTNDPIVATVNEEAIFASDIEREVKLKSTRDPFFRMTYRSFEDQLQMIIDKRLLIQEARKKRLDEKQLFIDTIKVFWEQTLIRNLVRHMEEHLVQSIEVTEGDLKKYYNRSSFQMVFQVIKSEDLTQLQKFYDTSFSQVPWDQEIGPIGYEDAGSVMIKEAFDLPQGARRIFTEGDDHYLVYAKKKIKMMLTSFEEMKDPLTERVREAKRQESFRAWFEDVKDQAKITIDKDNLKRLEYRYGQFKK